MPSMVRMLVLLRVAIEVEVRDLGIGPQVADLWASGLLMIIPQPDDRLVVEATLDALGCLAHEVGGAFAQPTRENQTKHAIKTSLTSTPGPTPMGRSVSY
jgi:hypothetical protein